MKNPTILTSLILTFCSGLLNPAMAQPLTVTTIAGRCENSYYANAVGTNAFFLGSPGCLAADPFGDNFVLDGQSVRKIAPDLTVTTFAGNAYTKGDYDGIGTSALFTFEALDYGDVAVFPLSNHFSMRGEIYPRF